MVISELIKELTAIMEKHGDLPCGGESDMMYVRVTACDEDGYAADGPYTTGPAHSVFLEVM